MRPVAMEAGVARRDRPSPALLAASLAASLARVLRSSSVSPVLFNVGRTDRDFSSAFPISSMRPGLSGVGAGAGAFGDPACGDPGWGGVVCTGGDAGGGAAACGQPL